MNEISLTEDVLRRILELALMNQDHSRWVDQHSAFARSTLTVGQRNYEQQIRPKLEPYRFTIPLVNDLMEFRERAIKKLRETPEAVVST